MYVNVRIDEDEIFSEIDDDVLLKELVKRKLAGNPDNRECRQTLDDVAVYLRSQGKIALAWRVDEIKNNRFG